MNIYKNTAIKGRVRKCIELLQSQKIKGMVVVDVGCSNGLIAHHTLMLSPKKFIGVDPSDKAIKIAKKNNPKGTFFKSTASELLAKSGSADLVIMFDVIEHVPKGTELVALKEAARVLKKGGKIILSTPHNHFLMNILDPAWYLGHRHYRLERIKGLLKNAGFKVTTAEVRGGVWFSIYLLALYVNKWIFKNPGFRNSTLESLDDTQFNKDGGIHTIFVTAVKR